jgi:hypothetical protein
MFQERTAAKDLRGEEEPCDGFHVGSARRPSRITAPIPAGPFLGNQGDSRALTAGEPYEGRVAPASSWRAVGGVHVAPARSRTERRRGQAPSRRQYRAPEARSATPLGGGQAQQRRRDVGATADDAHGKGADEMIRSGTRAGPRSTSSPIFWSFWPRTILGRAFHFMNCTNFAARGGRHANHPVIK